MKQNQRVKVPLGSGAGNGAADCCGGRAVCATAPVARPTDRAAARWCACGRSSSASEPAARRQCCYLPQARHRGSAAAAGSVLAVAGGLLLPWISRRAWAWALPAAARRRPRRPAHSVSCSCCSTRPCRAPSARPARGPARRRGKPACDRPAASSWCRANRADRSDPSCSSCWSSRPARRQRDQD